MTDADVGSLWGRDAWHRRKISAVIKIAHKGFTHCEKKYFSLNGNVQPRTGQVCRLFTMSHPWWVMWTTSIQCVYTHWARNSSQMTLAKWQFACLTHTLATRKMSGCDIKLGSCITFSAQQTINDEESSLKVKTTRISEGPSLSSNKFKLRNNIEKEKLSSFSWWLLPQTVQIVSWWEQIGFCLRAIAKEEGPRGAKGSRGAEELKSCGATQHQPLREPWGEVSFDLDPLFSPLSLIFPPTFLHLWVAISRGPDLFPSLPSKWMETVVSFPTHLDASRRLEVFSMAFSHWRQVLLHRKIH